MAVDVRLEAKIPFSGRWVARVVEAALRGEKAGRTTVTVLVTGDRKIRQINRRHLKHDTATDVISFGADERGYLGDIVVSAQTARSTARELGISFKEELARYLVHGTLHLLGYDDHAKKDRDAMHARQEELLKKALK